MQSRFEQMIGANGLSPSLSWSQQQEPYRQRPPSFSRHDDIVQSIDFGGQEPVGAYIVGESSRPRRQQTASNSPPGRNGPSRARDGDLPYTSYGRGDQHTNRTPSRSYHPREDRLQPQVLRSYFVESAAPSYGIQNLQLVASPVRTLPQQSLITAIPPALNPRTVQDHARASTATSSASVATNKGRKKSWWVTDCFAGTVDENNEKSYVCLACKIRKSGRLTASRLADHLWQCPNVTDDLKRRLYDSSTHIRSVVRRYSGESQSIFQTGTENGIATNKRRKINPTAQQFVEECPDSEADKITMKLVRSVVEFCLPFTIFDNQAPEGNSFRDAFLIARPGYRDKYPSRHKVMLQYLPRWYNQTYDVVKKNLSQMLSKGYGTVIFDGWDDINSSSVANILLRVESKSTRKTFFLDSVLTGHTKVGASEYVKIIKRVMGEFGGMQRICGVTSDNAKACVNARNELSKRYPGLIGIQDQAHVADLLMKDIGKLDFVRDVLDKVNLLVVETRSKRKLLSFVRDEMNRENKKTRQEEEEHRRDTLGSSLPADPLHTERLFPPLRKTAVMLRRPSPTRFASISDTLEAFIRTREVLGKVILDPQFDRHLFPADKPGQEEKRDMYKSLITSTSFLESVKQVHNVFRLCRRYLRVFDKETETTAADVIPCTDFLSRALDRVPTSDEYLTEERLDLIKSVFKRRSDGPITGRGTQVRLVEDVHVAALLLHPTKFPADYQPYNNRFYAYVKRFVFASVVKSRDEDDDEELKNKRVSLINAIMNDYHCIHSRWMFATSQGDENTSPAGEPTNTRLHDELAYRTSPIRFWMEELRTGNCEELCELALRTLSISPSSCAAERSLSVQGRIRTKLRNRLNQDVVRKMMFVKWNIKHYDESLKGAVVKKDEKMKGSSRRGAADLIAVEDDCGLSSDGSESDASESDASSGEVELDLIEEE